MPNWDVSLEAEIEEDIRRAEAQIQQAEAAKQNISIQAILLV
ncbi:MAG: hypothetical protein V7K55_17230 [Nostoc sp.]